MAIGYYTLNEIGRQARRELRRIAVEMKETIAAEERAAREAEPREREHHMLEATERVARNTEPRLVRSKMTVAEKASLISKNGQNA